MAFIDNPTIAALGDSLGLGSVFDAARAAQPMTAAATDQPKPGATKPNIPVYKERPYIPRNESPGGGVRPGVGGMAPTVPGTMDPATLQSDPVKELLGQYGVTPSTAPPDPNLFVHNPAAFEKHPVLAGMLERGLGSLANAHPGTNFFQSLVGGLKGNEEYDAQRAAQYNAQTMAPINQAMAIQGLQKGSDAHNAALDDISYHQGLLAHYTNQDMTKQERLASMPPKYDPKTGQPSYLQEVKDPETGETTLKYVPDEDWTPNAHDAMVRQYYENTKGALVKQYGSEDNIPPAEIMKALNGMETQQALAKGAATIEARKIGANATVTAAGIRGASGGAGAGGKPVRMNQVDTLQYHSIDANSKALDKRINDLSTIKSTYIDPDTGKTIIGGTKTALAEIARLRNLQSQFESQKKSITQKYGGYQTDTAPQAPQFSAGNPFAPKQN